MKLIKPIYQGVGYIDSYKLHLISYEQSNQVEVALLLSKLAQLGYHEVENILSSLPLYFDICDQQKIPLIEKEFRAINTNFSIIEPSNQQLLEIDKVIDEAGNEQTKCDRLEQIYNSYLNKQIRSALASNPNTPVQILIKLAEQFPQEFLENCVLDLYLLENPNLIKQIPKKSFFNIIQLPNIPHNYVKIAFDYLKKNHLYNNEREIIFKLISNYGDLWNQWRQEHQEVKIDFRGLNARNINLANVNLSNIDLAGIIFENAHLNQIDFQGAKLICANFTNAILQEINLSHVDLSSAILANVDLRNSNLEKVNFKHAKLLNVNLEGVDLSSIKFDHVNLENANLKKTNLKETSFQWAYLKGVKLDNALNIDDKLALIHHIINNDLSQRNFNQLVLEQANLRGVYLEAANLQQAKLSNLNLKYAHLQFANLDQAQLYYLNFRYANLQSASLRGAKLVRCNLQYANLEGANLQDAILENVSLYHTNLDNANLENAELRNVNLYGVNLKNANLQGFKVSDRMKFSKEFQALFEQDKSEE